MPSSHTDKNADVTALLQRWSDGDEQAQAPLLEEIYAELALIATRLLSKERHVLELQPENLISEAYLKLTNIDRINWTNRTHFFAMSARVMREILIDEARKRKASKRDGGLRITMYEGIAAHAAPITDVLVLHEALERLAEVDPDRAYLVELRFFGGLTNEETAEVMNISVATVKRHWEVARGWLYRAITSSDSKLV